MLFLVTFIYALVLTGALILTNRFHGAYTFDKDMKGSQKFHRVLTPRIGGLTIILSFLLGLTTVKHEGNYSFVYAREIFTPLLIVFIAGFLEDVTKVITPLERTLFFVIALIIAIYLTHCIAVINHTGFESLDKFIEYVPYLGLVLTFFCVIGLTNAYNVIDGYHGLATIAALINMLGLAGIEYLVHDDRAMLLIFGFLGALLGFLVYNYPKGKIFLGDGGAYMIGFLIAVGSIRVIQRHPGDISPYATLLMAIYPITELGFSIYRKKFLRKMSATKPDGLHFHMLIFKRCTNFSSKTRNPSVVLIMLSMIIPQAILATVFHNNHLYCLMFIAAYVFIYVFFYFKIVRFKTPGIFKFMLNKNPVLLA